jgi:hypothetical protein
MHDQRVEAGPGLGCEYRSDGMVVCRITAEPIYGLRRKRDEPPGAQQRGGAGDRRRAGGGNVSDQPRFLSFVYSAADLLVSAERRAACRSISDWIAALAFPRKSSWCCTAKS